MTLSDVLEILLFGALVVGVLVALFRRPGIHVYRPRVDIQNIFEAVESEVVDDEGEEWKRRGE